MLPKIPRIFILTNLSKKIRANPPTKNITEIITSFKLILNLIHEDNIKRIFMHLVSKHARPRILFDLFHGLNLERYKLGKTGKILYNHPKGTHDDRFWATALAIYAAKQASLPSRPIARII